MNGLLRLLALGMMAALSCAAHAVTDSQLLSWVEGKYPQYFRGAATGGQYQQYSYRYYPATDNYLGVDALGNVFVVGKDFGTTIRSFGMMQDYLDGIAAAQAPQTAMNTRKAVAISGTVTDTAGEPIAGVTVKAFHHNDHVTLITTTDANGVYRFTGLDYNNDSRYTAEYAVYAEKAGLAISPATTTVGTNTRFDFNGYYRSVVRLFPMPMTDTAGINFSAARTGDKQTGLPRTGQQKSHALGDDASAAAGVVWPSVRFIDNKDGTITDQLTGLIWLHDAGCLGVTNWNLALTAANRLAEGACGLTDGSSAGQWRLPNVNELESLIDISQSLPALAAGNPFIGVADSYWSSTTYTAGPGNAMAIRFTDGRWINGVDGAYDNNKQSSSNGVWAVKSGSGGNIAVLATGVYSGIGGRTFGMGDDANLQTGLRWATQRFIDNGDGTVADTVTGLVWLKQANCINQDWSASLAAIDKLASGQCGLTDGSSAGQWRLPNRSEMLSISDRAPTFPQANYFDGIPSPDGISVTSPTIFNNFISSDYYWTSSTLAADAAYAWTVYSCDFGVYQQLKSDSPHHAMAVRRP